VRLTLQARSALDLPAREALVTNIQEALRALVTCAIATLKGVALEF
jgi:hypothetical protein